MNIRFSIKSTSPNATKEGDTFVRYSGLAEPFNKVDERACEKVGEFPDGSPKLVFNTGLEPDKVDFYSWLSEDEKKVVKEQIEELRKTVVKIYGGESVIDPTNRYFWMDNREVSRLHIDNSKLNVYYDAGKSPAHALLYLSILSGAFMGIVAPNKEWAERYQIPMYLSLESNEDISDEEDVTRSDAHAALSELRKESHEGLFILAWCIQYDTRAYGAYLRSTPIRELVNYHIKYIDGKLVTKRKRNTPKVFLEYYEKWKGKLTRPQLYTEAYIKAGEWYNFVQQKEKKYTTAEGTILGNTIEEAVQNIMKPKFQQDFEKLRELVEQKWKE